MPPRFPQICVARACWGSRTFWGNLAVDLCQFMSSLCQSFYRKDGHRKKRGDHMASPALVPFVQNVEVILVFFRN